MREKPFVYIPIELETRNKLKERKVDELVILAKNAVDKEDWNSALGYYEQILEIDSTNWTGNLGAGGTLYRLGDFSAALDHANMAYEYAPNDMKNSIQGFMEIIESELSSEK